MFILYLEEDFDGDVKVQVINTIGAVVLEKITTGVKSISLDIENQPTGIYFIKVQSGKDFKIEKVIKN